MLDRECALMILNTTKAEGDMLPNLRKAAMLLVVLGEGPARSCCSNSPKRTSRRSAARWPN